MTDNNSPAPRRQLLEEISRDRQVNLSDEEIEAARAMLARYRGELERLRSIRFDFLDPIEPAHAVQWIQNGGRST